MPRTPRLRRIRRWAMAGSHSARIGPLGISQSPLHAGGVGLSFRRYLMGTVRSPSGNSILAYSPLIGRTKATLPSRPACNPPVMLTRSAGRTASGARGGTGAFTTIKSSSGRPASSNRDEPGATMPDAQLCWSQANWVVTASVGITALLSSSARVGTHQLVEAISVVRRSLGRASSPELSLLWRRPCLQAPSSQSPSVRRSRRARLGSALRPGQRAAPPTTCTIETLTCSSSSDALIPSSASRWAVAS